MTTPEPPDIEFNRSMNDDSEETGIRLIQSLFPRIDTAAAKIIGECVSVVGDRSSLWLDDRYFGRWRTGSLHGAVLTSGIDALLVVKAILESVLRHEAPLRRSPF